MDDAKLLQAYVDDRSQQAFTRIVERYLSIVYSTALRRCSGSPEQAKDVTQIVFIRLAQKARSLLRHPTLAGWLHRSAALEAASTQRAELRRQQRETAAASHPDWSGADAVEWEQLSPLLDEALLELSEHDREAIVLRFFASKPFAVVGEQLGLAENAARMRVDRALIRLRARLARHGITSTGAALGLVLANNAAGAAPIGLAATVSSAVATGVTGGSAGVTGALGLVLMTKIQLGVFTAVLGVLVSGVVWEQRAGTSATHRLLDEEQRAERLKRSLADFAATPASAESPQAAPATYAPTPDDQEKKRVRLLISRKLQDKQYAALFRRLRLPPTKLEELKDLLAEREWDREAAHGFAREQGLERLTNSESSRLSEVADPAVNLKIHALLGEASYQQFEQYDRSSTLWNLFSIYRSELKLLGDPLTDPQMETLADLGFVYMTPSLDTAPDTGGPEIPPEMLADAASFLSPLQLDRLRAMEEVFHARRRLAEINREAAMQGKLTLTERSAQHYPGSPVDRR